MTRRSTIADATVATSHPLATEAGIAMLRQGGCAVDAGVAATFALAVLEPFHSGLGGLTALVYHDARSGKSGAIDGSATLPSDLASDAFRLVPGGAPAGVYGWPAVVADANLAGASSVAVPGAVAALCEAQRLWGRLSLARVMEPAIRLAKAGFDIDWYFAAAVAAVQSNLQDNPDSARVFLRPDGSCLRPGILGLPPDRLRQPNLAASLSQIALGGPDALYGGALGERLCDAMAHAGSSLRLGDLAGYRLRIWTAARESDYRGYCVQGVPENSGSPTLMEALNILELFDLSGTRKSVDRAHIMAEAFRRAFVDRLSYLGDPYQSEVPTDQITSKAYARMRAASIDLATSEPITSPGHLSRPGTRAVSGSVSRRDADTTHVSVIDGSRNAVAITSTIGSVFGSMVVAGDTGILMNNGAMWFNPILGLPNSVAPGRRALVAGCPTLLLKDGRLVLACGAPGGRRIISAVAQLISNFVDLKRSAQAAIDAPRLHAESDVTFLDSRFPAVVVDGLRAKGHTVRLLTEGIGTGWFARPNAVEVAGATLRAGAYRHTPSGVASLLVAHA